MMWFDKNDSIETILNHLGDKVPSSISEDAKRELRDRGWDLEKIREEEWNRTD